MTFSRIAYWRAQPQIEVAFQAMRGIFWSANVRPFQHNLYKSARHIDLRRLKARRSTVLPNNFAHFMKITYDQFLRLKIDVYSQMFEVKASREGFVHLFYVPLEELIGKNRLSKTAAIRVERNIEGFVRDLVQDDKIKEARRELRKRIGVDHLGLSIDAQRMVKRVLYRKRIADDFEADIVRKFVSNISNEALIGKAAFRRLAAILETADH